MRRPVLLHLVLPRVDDDDVDELAPAVAEVPRPVAPGHRGGGDRQAVSRFVGDVARRVGGTLDLDRTLDQVVQAVVELVGFRVAVLNLLTAQGDLEVVTVAGSDEVRTELLGSRETLASWEGLLAAAQPVGALRFADASVAMPGAVWLPDLPRTDDPRAWQPEDALFAPLHGADGRLLGVLSVDLPADGLRPDEHTCELLELFAVQASLALDHARVHARLQRSESLFQRTFEHSPVGMAVFDGQRRFVRVNPGYCRFLGLPEQDLLGRTILEFSHPDDRAVVTSISDRVRTGSESFTGVERRYLRPDGSVVWGRVTLILLDGDGEQEVLASVVDTTEARAVAAELERRASSDPLTGLANRSTFEAVLAGRLAGVHQVAVLFCDIDRFKQVNDSLGHAAGDELLREVAQAVSDVLRTQDLAARLGGDEFVLLLGDVKGPEHAVSVAERVRLAARRRVHLGDRSVLSSMTVGVALSEPGVTGDQLLARADRALYRAKGLGRDRVELARAPDDN